MILLHTTKSNGWVLTDNEYGRIHYDTHQNRPPKVSNDHSKEGETDSRLR